ncbi:hypothetical protein KQI52_00525 [bacterium]|nr:hypothetical protein [bacterium]
MADTLSIDSLVGRSATMTNTEVQSGTVDKDGFLQLLIEQMKNQDPMNPMDSTEYTAQLAQFTTLEEMQNQTAVLQESLQADYILSQAINNTLAGSLVGTDVKAYSDTVVVSDGEGSDISFELDDLAEDVEVTILDSDGNELRSMELGKTLSGEHTIEWDGEDNKGNTLADGEYTVEVTATDSAGNESPATTYVIGTIQAVRYDANGAMLVVDGVKVYFGDVLELRNPDDDNEGDGLNIAGLIGLGGGS